jgi:hypothetical protein
LVVNLFWSAKAHPVDVKNKNLPSSSSASNIKQLVFPETVTLKDGLAIKVFKGMKKHF